jgi:hypothetical protein
MMMLAQTAMDDLVASAWECYRKAIAVGVDAIVRPSIPILFFGDCARFFGSPLRVVTVGLNPSCSEFPMYDRFARFPGARHDDKQVPPVASYLRSLADYFVTDPYTEWFDPSFEPILNGLGSSFYAGQPSTALHTDFCSPIATDPTWSGLRSERKILIRDGGPLWHRLIERLEPDIILMSVAGEHLDAIRFPWRGDWRELHVIQRENPYFVGARDILIAPGRKTTLVFGKAAQKPFGKVSEVDKRTVGALILKDWERGARA